MSQVAWDKRGKRRGEKKEKKREERAPDFSNEPAIPGSIRSGNARVLGAWVIFLETLDSVSRTTWNEQQGKVSKANK